MMRGSMENNSSVFFDVENIRNAFCLQRNAQPDDSRMFFFSFYGVCYSTSPYKNYSRKERESS